MVLKSIIGAVCACLTVVSFSASAVTYEIVDLGSLGSGSGAYDLNAAQEVVGNSTNSSGQTRAFLWDKTSGMQDLGKLTNQAFSNGYGINDSGQVVGSSGNAFIWDSVNGMQDLGTFGGTSSYGLSINNAGQVVGASNLTGDTAQHAFIWDSVNGMQDIGTLGGTDARGDDINEVGQVVGSGFTSGNTAWHAFIWDNVNGMQDLGTLGGDSRAEAVNDAGVVVGYSKITSNNHAFLWDSVNGMQDLGTLGTGDNSSAFDINNSGQVVGSSGNAFIWDNVNGMQDLCVVTECNAAGWTDLTSAFAINDNGDIVGIGTIDGESRAFLVSAVPIPPAVWLFGSGLIGLIGLARRKASA